MKISKYQMLSSMTKETILGLQLLVIKINQHWCLYMVMEGQVSYFGKLSRD
jgi:hypothetical protein